MFLRISDMFTFPLRIRAQAKYLRKHRERSMYLQWCSLVRMYRSLWKLLDLQSSQTVLGVGLDQLVVPRKHIREGLV
jgi:hypothetical protein